MRELKRIMTKGVNIPAFPGYKFERGEEVGEGGHVYAEPGIYSRVDLLDIASWQRNIIRTMPEESFGPEYTKRFANILTARITKRRNKNVNDRMG